MHSVLPKFLIAGTVLAVSYIGYVAVEGQFQLKNITYENDADVFKEEDGQQQSEIPQSLQEILNQPYSYLDRGRQSFAFVSKDGKYVLKFFDTGCFRTHLVPIFGSKSKKVCIKKMSLLISGYKLAFERDKDNAGLIYVQTSPHKIFQGVNVHLTDRFGLTHDIDLGVVPFVVQYKAIPTRVVISELLNQGDVEGVKAKLKALVSMYKDEYSKGLFDRDHNYMYNTGFIGNKPIRLDVGRLRADEAMKQRDVYMKDLRIIVRRTDEWLGRHFPKYRLQITEFLRNSIND